MSGIFFPTQDVDMSSTLWLYLVVLVIGLVVGSFLNVCIVRLPNGRSIVRPGSHCVGCQQPIAWYDNVPLISFVLLRGRCRHCQARISPRYPLIELLNGIGYLAILAKFGMTLPTIVYAAFFSSLVVVTWIDLDHLIIPDVISLPGIVVGFLCAATILPVGWLNSVIGIVLGGGILWMLAALSPHIFGKEGLGGGDIKFLAMVGAFLGWQPVLLTLFLASVTGSIIGVLLLLLKVMERGHYIPFGPFLATGALVSLFFYREIIGWYFGIV